MMIILTTQEVFDISVAGVIKQGKPAAVVGQRPNFLSCRYRTNDGLKCAAGQLIPDYAYKPSIEGFPVQEALKACSISLSDEALELTTKLQSIHDGLSGAGDEFLEKFIEEVSLLGTSRGLNIEILNKCGV